MRYAPLLPAPTGRSKLLSAPLSAAVIKALLEHGADANEALPLGRRLSATTIRIRGSVKHVHADADEVDSPADTTTENHAERYRNDLR